MEFRFPSWSPADLSICRQAGVSGDPSRSHVTSIPHVSTSGLTPASLSWAFRLRIIMKRGSWRVDGPVKKPFAPMPQEASGEGLITPLACESEGDRGLRRAAVKKSAASEGTVRGGMWSAALPPSHPEGQALSTARGLQLTFLLGDFSKPCLWDRGRN